MSDVEQEPKQVAEGSAPRSEFVVERYNFAKVDLKRFWFFRGIVEVGDLAPIFQQIRGSETSPFASEFWQHCNCHDGRYVKMDWQQQNSFWAEDETVQQELDPNELFFVRGLLAMEKSEYDLAHKDPEAAAAASYEAESKKD